VPVGCGLTGFAEISKGSKFYRRIKRFILPGFGVCFKWRDIYFTMFILSSGTPHYHFLNQCLFFSRLPDLDLFL